MDPTSALVPYSPSEATAKALLWSTLAPDVRRRNAMAAASEHDSPALLELLHCYVLVKGRTRSYVSPHTVKGYRAAGGRLISAWAQENLLHPSQDAGDRYVQALSETLAPASIDMHLAGAKTLFKALRWARATTADPFAEVTAPRNPVPKHERRRPYSQSEFDQLVRAATGQDLLLLFLCGHGGLRIAEALALRWRDVDRAGRTLRISAAKGGSARVVHLSATLSDLLSSWWRLPVKDHLVVSSRGTPYGDATIPRARLQALCAGAGVPYRGFHALRHLAGTRLMRQVHDLQVVAAHLGHRSIQTTTIYAHWDDSALAAAVGEW